jgi:hypothetical protein
MINEFISLFQKCRSERSGCKSTRSVSEPDEKGDRGGEAACPSQGAIEAYPRARPMAQEW